MNLSKAAILGLFFMALSTVAIADDMKCVESPREVKSDIVKNGSPMGEWGTPQDKMFTMEITLDRDSDTIMMERRTLDFKRRNTIELCVRGDRTFFRDRDGFHEYYMKGKNKLLVADDEYDVEDDEPRSEFGFDEFTRK